MVQLPVIREEERCYFCENQGMVSFKRVYVFCPNCTAIYRFTREKKPTCEHIKDAPIIYRHPWRTENVGKPFIYNAISATAHHFFCSECDAPVLNVVELD